MKLRTKSSLLAIVTLVASLLAVAAPAAAHATPTCDGKAATIVGTNGNDRIQGTSGNDVIVGLGGRDRLFGGAGNDIICGGGGSDLLRGERGRDRLFGDQGNDRLQGNNGADYLDGGSGRDALRGDRGNDQIVGGRGADRVSAGPDSDWCDLDRLDTFNFCERGDVRASNGVGDGVFNVAVNNSFVAHRSPDFDGSKPYHVIEVLMLGGDEFDSHSINVLDADGNSLRSFRQSGTEWVAEYLVKGKPARIEVQTTGSWEVVVKKRELVEKLGAAVTGVGSQVFYLRRPLGANATGSFLVGDDVEGNVILQTYVPNSFADLRVNEIHPRDNGINLYEGPERIGTYLVSIRVGEGTWELTFTG